MNTKATLHPPRQVKPKAGAGPARDSAPEAVNCRGGRIDFDSSLDVVDEASQQSFPASDPPAWNLPDPRDGERLGDRGNNTDDSAGPPTDQVAVLAHELWESQGRPEGTELEDWFRAERFLMSSV